MPYERSHGPLFRQPPNPRTSRMTIPKGVGPHVRLVFAEMRRQGRGYSDLEVASGVLRPKAWRKKNRPGLDSMEAVLGSLGWRLTPTPELEVLPAELAAEVSLLAEKMEAAMPEVWAALIAVSLQQRKTLLH